MKSRLILASAAALTLAAAPTMAQVQLDRATAPVEDASAANGTGIIVGILALAAIIAGIVIAAKGGDEVPTSP